MAEVQEAPCRSAQWSANSMSPRGLASWVLDDRLTHWGLYQLNCRCDILYFSKGTYVVVEVVTQALGLFSWLTRIPALPLTPSRWSHPIQWLSLSSLCWFHSDWYHQLSPLTCTSYCDIQLYSSTWISERRPKLNPWCPLEPVLPWIFPLGKWYKSCLVFHKNLGVVFANSLSLPALI